jgi:acyl transferase domain-containing protein
MGNGAAVVVLKRLKEALAEGDQIYSVIMGTHINNDGSVRVSYTAPGLNGQSEVIAQAIENAGVDIETISYIEAHGTATRLGDQVEFAALQKAFAQGTQKKQFCALGSLKPNIGHLDRASGVAGLIKTSLALKHREIPPSLNFEKASPDIDLASSPFYVNTSLKSWDQVDGSPRRAGVSSFGLGGTNAHVVLEEAPLLEATSPARPWQLLVYSAKTSAALDAMGKQLRSHLATHEELNLADAAYTLQVGRTAFNHRRFLVAQDSADAQARLAAHTTLSSTYQTFSNRALTLLFPAATSFDAVLAQELYHDEAEYRQMVASAYKTIHTLPGLEKYSLLEAKSAAESAVAALVSSYAQAGLVLTWGITPYAVSGAAYGLDVAAVVAGLLSLEDAVRLTIKRSEVETGSAEEKELSSLIRKLGWQTPKVPYLSLTTGTLITDQQASSAAFWLKDALQASALPGTIARLLAKQERVFLEMGQGENIEQVKALPDYLPEYAGRAIALLTQESQVGRQQILCALGRLWLAGVSLDWSKGYTHECRRRASLPTYPFDKKRYWLEDAHVSATPATKKPESLLAAGAKHESDRRTRSNVSAVHLSLKDFEKTIAEIWQQVLGLPEVGLYDDFFDLDGDSVIGLQVISKLREAFNMPIPATALYEAPTVSTLARYLLPAEGESNAQEQRDLLKERRDQARQSSMHEEIAIISMNGRFPGAPNVDVFWENLRNGVESVSFFTEEELIEAGCDPRRVRDPAYVKARPLLPVDIEKFDALFFGYSPREAELTDPQHRLFLECAWEALELAGYNPARYDGQIGVFAGTNISTYIMGMLNGREALTSDNFQILIGNEKDALTTNVSYKMNLKGPSYAVQTFCSTSLVAVHLACQSLLHGESDIAMAGGVSILVPVKTGHMYEEGGMESPDGHSRTFDSQARGSMYGDAVGIVVLKRLSDALADGDIIHAVIKGSAINNDGSLKVSYTATSVVGQSSAVMMALEAAGISPESISYVEAHGTTTRLGDPIEVASLSKAYRAHTDQVGYCAIGSVKTNVGHLDRASGVSGLIKTVMALKHKEIPASLHFQEPNPEIDFENSPFYVNTQLSPWETDGLPRRAGINSLGLGGTNAHVIVEEAPEREPSGPSRPWQVLTLSARTASALAQSTQRLYAHLQENPELPLADVAYTLQVGRKLMDHRRVIVCRDTAEALRALNNPSDVQPMVLTDVETRTDQHVAFLFPGVGERSIEVAQALYHSEDAFRSSIDSCHVFLQKECGLDLRNILQLDHVEEQNSQIGSTAHGKPDLQRMLGCKESGAEPKRTALAQPSVFAVEYALAQLLLQWGVRPQAMLGYSLGEYVAACLAGVFSLKDALHLVASRARLIDAVEAGTMLAVMLSEEEIQSYLSEQVNLAIQNSQTACVLAGPIPAIERVEQRLLADDVACHRVETTHAFHSQMLSHLEEKVTRLAQSVKLHAPQVPYVSTLTGTWITDEQATDPAYWAQHMCQTVRFAEGVGLLLEKTDCLLLEVGPGQALSFFARQHPAGALRDKIFPTLPAPHGQHRQDPHAFLLSTLGRLWLAGVPLNWQGYYANEKRQRVILPTYPFERQRYWIERSSFPIQVSASCAQEQRQVLAPAEILADLKKEE